MKPILSIIIVSFNTEKLTRGCVESILKNSSGGNYETIVVDNDSKDGSVEMLRKYKSELSNFRLIENSENLGFSKASNQATRLARGKYILLLNSDTLVKKNSLENLVDFAEETKDCGVVGARLLNVDGSIQLSCLKFPTIVSAIKEYFLGRKGLLDKFAPSGNKPAEVNAVVGAAFLITPRAIKKVGLLDERYFFYFEDIDYCKRVWKAGLKVYYLPDSEIIHHHGASGKNLADEKNQWRRLIPSSKIYHGVVGHYVLNFVLWLGQKWQKLFTD